MPKRSKAAELSDYIKTCYYKWEFLRRNSQYKRDHEEFQKPRGASSRQEESALRSRKRGKRDLEKPVKNLADNVQDEAELCWKWGIYRLTRPEFHIPRLNLETDPDLLIYNPFHTQMSLTVTAPPNSYPMKDSHLSPVLIDLRAPDDTILASLKSALPSLRVNRQVPTPKTTKHRFDAYEQYLQVFDMRQAGRTWPEIAEALDPKGYRKHKGWRSKPDFGGDPRNPVTMRVKGQYQAACRLIEGGLRKNKVTL
ncbi:MAG: hypothetical protein HY211_08510 [Candidatus Omnitrophica bacterium]|nr:hypothetical protein [Candidatus Omnitrophota bacterium]